MHSGLVGYSRANISSLCQPSPHKGLLGLLKKAVEADKEQAQKILPDRVHPTPAGHLIMAAALLKAWHAPALV
jgi:phospholipase/lecithinase/hemolysin